MFDRVSEAAERLATTVSRRAFLGGLGKASLAVAGALGFAGAAQAGGSKLCCLYQGVFHNGWKTSFLNSGDPCPPPPSGFKFAGSTTVGTCSQCKAPK